jgi:hypothetical protein
MLYFPQLSSGAVGQYPIGKTSTQRSVVSTLPDGSTVKYADSGASLVEWQLQFQSLADSEIAVLQQFFAACEGQLNAFTFADPAGNLLAWSEDLTQPAWQGSTLLQIVGGISDPDGGTSATQVTNPTATDLTILQTVNTPGWYWYCFSVYVKSQTGVSVTLQRQAGGVSSATGYPTGPEWQRIDLSGQTETAAVSVTAGITIPAGASVDVFGFQLEPQPVASQYKSSYAAGDVHTDAHFSNDTLAITTSAPNCNQCTLMITAY